MHLANGTNAASTSETRNKQGIANIFPNQMNWVARQGTMRVTLIWKMLHVCHLMHCTPMKLIVWTKILEQTCRTLLWEVYVEFGEICSESRFSDAKWSHLIAACQLMDCSAYLHFFGQTSFSYVYQWRIYLLPRALSSRSWLSRDQISLSRILF